MAIDNAEIAGLFNRYADLLEIENANPFRVRAYRNAARVVGTSSCSMSDLVAEDRDLDELPGIGKNLAAKIETIVRTGRLPQLAQIETRVPRALADLMNLPGLGPKRVKLLYFFPGEQQTVPGKARRNGVSHGLGAPAIDANAYTCLIE